METTTENREIESQEELKPMNVEFGDRDSKWAQYDIYTAPVVFKDAEGNAAPTSYKAIFKSNKLISIMSKRYQLLPNEKALEMADEIASKIGFKRHEVYHSRDGNYMNATYLNKSDKSFTIDVNSDTVEGNGESARAELKDGKVGDVREVEEHYTINREWEHRVDEVYFGFSIHNSIDGSSGFGAGTRGGIQAGYDQGSHRGFGFRLFTLRKVCMNGAIVRSNLIDKYTTTADSRLKIDTKLLEMPKIKATVRHTGAMTEKAAEDRFMEAITKSMSYIDRHLSALANLYRRWTTLQMTTTMAEKLLFLPDKYLPETIEVKDGKLTDAELYKSLSVWECFNQVTDAVWHSESLGIKSKEAMLDKLHEALYQPIEVV